MADGYAESVTAAQDCCFQCDLVTYGGNGYGHILENIVPRLKNLGVDEKALHQILVENPKRVLTFRDPAS